MWEIGILFTGLSLAITALFIAAALFLGIQVLSTLFARGGGWAKLAERFPAATPPQGERRTMQTVELGGLVRYRWCVTVVMSPRGLYLALASPILPKHSPMLIPWSEVKGVRCARLYWWLAVRLTIGEPPVSTITVWLRLFEAMRPYLPAELVQGT
jgi:hypothetical protein